MPPSVTAPKSPQAVPASEGLALRLSFLRLKPLPSKWPVKGVPLTVMALLAQVKVALPIGSHSAMEEQSMSPSRLTTKSPSCQRSMLSPAFQAFAKARSSSAVAMPLPLSVPMNLTLSLFQLSQA